MVDPDVLRRFSSGAARYETHAHAQRLSARDLLAYTMDALRPSPGGGRSFEILEPGCGTGLYTRMLLEAFPAATLLGVDISEAMVRVANRRIDDPRARFAVADAEEIAAGRYDLVTSNAAFQWFLSLPRTLTRMASLLSDGGVLTFSFFGPGTYAELDHALRTAADGHGRPSAAAGRDAPGLVAAADGHGRPSAAAGRDAPGVVAAAGFHTRDEIAESLSASFPHWEIEDRVYHQDFPTLADLLRNIRYTGTGGGGSRESWTPGRLARVDAAYRERYGGIRATYQVFLCRGVIPEGWTG